MDAYYSSGNQYYDDDDDGESISSGSNDRNDGPIGGGVRGNAWGRDGVAVDGGGGGGGMSGGMPKIVAGLNDDDDDEYDDDENFMTGYDRGGGTGDNNNNNNIHNNGGGVGGGGGNVVDFDDPRIASLPRILLMGPRRAGKTSIQRVVFHKMSPHETLFRLEATQTLERAVVDHTPLCRFTIWDFPGEQYEYGYGGAGGVVGGGGMNAMNEDGGINGYATNEEGGGDVDGSNNNGTQQQQQQQANDAGGGDDQIFAKATALIFVLDAQDEPYDHVLQSFTDTVTRAIRANPAIAIEVFVHKVDGELFLSDEAKYDCRRDVMQQVADELADAGLSHDAIPISYHLTSIYDHSVFEAFSRVVQRLIPELPTLEHLLNVLVSTCSMEKAYLFDVASKLYISTDSSPVDMQSVELCSDMIDVVLDVSGIYGAWGGGKKSAGAEPTTAAPAGTRRRPPPSSEDGGGEDADGMPHHAGGDAHHLGGGDPRGTNEIGGCGDDGDDDDDDDGLIRTDVDGDDGEDDELLGKLVGHNSLGGPPFVEDDAGSAYDSESSSTIHLSNGMVLYLKEVDTMLALVCLTRAENFRKKSLINYNIGCLKKALMALPQIAQEVSEGGI